jgi:transglutaminase-like putative cysteine protease
MEHFLTNKPFKRTMTPKAIFLSALIFSGQILFAQKKLPTIKATSKTVDIRDGNIFKKAGWAISPEVKPDIYNTSSLHKKVTFYTDKDSISIKITPTTKFDFIILLNDSTRALTQIKYRPGYLDILKTAGNYNFNDKRPIPKFSYQSKDDSNLIALRKGFKLDSVAGEGNEVSKILNLLHWVHNLIPHDGNHENPTAKNALSLIAECRKDSRGLNCRGLATVLNECYLSLGIPSRFITCMPKDSVFDDCHVINMVYSKDFKKWLWIDPTNDAYVMNEKGGLLSIEDTRDRIIHGRPIILNPEANWNHKVSQIKEEYLYKYMTKNLYRMECPLESKYDYETWQNGKTVTYVELLSLNAHRQWPQVATYTNAKTGTTFINYKTNNPALFWASPE